MDRPVRLSFVLVVVLCVTPLKAQDVASSGAATQALEPVVSSAQSERAVSPHVAELLAASMPKYQPTAPPEKKSELATPADHESDKPANGIVHLPRYVVREAKLPEPTEVMPTTRPPTAPTLLG